MTVDPGSNGIAEVGQVTKANASTKLTEQLAAVAAFTPRGMSDRD